MKTLIVDGNHTIHRLLFKMPVLTNASGKAVQLVYGFLKLIRGLINDFEPDAVLIAWDVGLPRIRLEIWPDYKKHRIAKKLAPDDKHKMEMSVMMSQIAILRGILPMLGVCQMGIDGLEADDIIALACEALPGKRVVVSSDTDMLQLVRKGVSVYSPLHNKRYHHKNFEKHFGLTPRQHLEAKALAGEGTDGIPGVAAGFGEKSAKDAIMKYKNLAEILSDWEDGERALSWGGKMSLLRAAGVKEAAERNLQLMDLGLMTSPTAKRKILKNVGAPKKVDEIKIMNYLKANQFNSLLENFLDWIGPFKRLES